MKLSLEFRYFLFFTLVLTLFIVISLQACFQATAGWLYSSCQTVLLQILDIDIAIDIILVLSVGLIVTIFAVKFIFSSYKTQKKLSSYQHHISSQLPKKIERIINSFSIPEETIVLVKKQSFLAITGGFLSPKIFLSDALTKILSAKELEAVILHESYHLQKFHGLLFVFADALGRSAKFLLPSCHDLVQKMRLEFELAADDYAIRCQGTDKYLVAALQKLTSQPDPLFPSFSSARALRLQFKNHTPLFSTSAVSHLVRTLSSVLLLGTLFFYSLSTTFQSQVNFEQACLSDTQCQAHCFSAADSKQPKQNYSPILPASVF